MFVWVAFLTVVLLGASGCTESSLCEDPESPKTCACKYACNDAQLCENGECVLKKVEEIAACEPSGLVCEDHEICLDGRCECDEKLTWNNDEMCGCAAEDCTQNDDAELCVGKVCQCDWDKHKASDISCGCPDPARCNTGDFCDLGKCTCDPVQHLNDSSRCNCGPACTGGRICQTGVCTCGPGFVVCGNDCVAADHACCADGWSCPGGHTCEPTGEQQFVCRPPGTQACYGDTVYLGWCPQDTQCLVGDDEHFACIPAEYVQCISLMGEVLGVCASGETCHITAANTAVCLAPGMSTCPDDTVCDAGRTCQKTADGFACHPNTATPCYDNGFYVDACPSGWACGEDGMCLHPGDTVCGDMVTVCPAGSACQETKTGYACQPPGTLACFDEEGFFTHTCDSGKACKKNGCLLPGWSLCGDEISMCPPGFMCLLSGLDSYDCHPNQYVPCFSGEGYYTHMCLQGQTCLDGGFCN